MEIVKRCKVCGDKGAQGFNFSAQGLSCNSCKVFFHRHAHKHQTVKCKKDAKCLIDLSNRKSCMKCRLDKCVSIGMVKKAKQIELSNKEECTMPKVSHIEMSALKNILLETSSEVQIEEIKTDTKIMIKKKRKFSNNLNCYEMNRISDVQKAVDVFVEETLIKNIRVAENFLDALGSPEFLIETIVKFCKNLSPFSRLSEQDQFALFKPFGFKILSLRRAFSFDLEKDGFVASEDKFGNRGIFIKYELFEPCVNYDFNKRFTIGLNKEMDNDRTIRDLLSAQQLFTSQSKVSCPEFIRYNYIFYSRLLCRYLEHKYKCPRLAKNKFELLMNLLANIDLVKLFEGKMFRGIAKDKLPRVYVQIYDLV